jgi:hypothetical protein
VVLAGVVPDIRAFAEEKMVAVAFARNEVALVEVVPGIVVLVDLECPASVSAAWALDHAVLSWAEPVYPLVFLSF